MASENDKNRKPVEDDSHDSVEVILTKVTNAYFRLCRRLASALNRKKSGR